MDHAWATEDATFHVDLFRTDCIHHAVGTEWITPGLLRMRHFM